ncbi:Rh161.1 [macacine betaherpesvirus 3]|nr:Rh161.1 [macacine betaherpesvirus 3]
MRFYVVCVLMCMDLSYIHGLNVEQRCLCIGRGYHRIPRKMTCLLIQYPGPGCENSEAIAYFNFAHYRTPMCLDYENLKSKFPKKAGAWCRVGKRLLKLNSYNCEECNRMVNLE